VSAPTDEALLERSAQGDQGAIGELYDRYQGMVYGMATRITGDRTLAEDVVQETFVGIWRNAGRYSAELASPRTWILSIAHHRAVDAVRRRRPASQLPDPELPPPDALVSPDIWPEVSRGIDAGTVRTALAGLPASQREAIEMVYFAGLTQHEIAQRTETPLGTVKSRVRLGLVGLRRNLEGRTGDPDRDLVERSAQPFAMRDRA
jgi:RNA polymerase sigma-70 factor (ECF subfamily)